jgi:hypothetical protein
MKPFRVAFKKEFAVLDEPAWSFYIDIVSRYKGLTFPVEFLAFDHTDTAECDTVVYITDNTQALVAYDYLLEHGWELDTETDNPQRLAFIDLMNATASK